MGRSAQRVVSTDRAGHLLDVVIRPRISLGRTSRLRWMVRSLTNESRPPPLLNRPRGEAMGGPRLFSSHCGTCRRLMDDPRLRGAELAAARNNHRPLRTSPLPLAPPPRICERLGTTGSVEVAVVLEGDCAGEQHTLDENVARRLLESFVLVRLARAGREIENLCRRLATARPDAIASRARTTSRTRRLRGRPQRGKATTEQVTTRNATRARVVGA